ncbi:MAG: hypothetical protein CR982_03950 [Candidatus Cloacimonadota bacterium]|nr:MAG: hypothetical protein CR982_03950 [Candidatus Cloacimonadota bacterium]PIE77685.1 MAG: hypothetical protein CSA15_11730 [Candidatus Delongbacteria bacterium]
MNNLKKLKSLYRKNSLYFARVAECFIENGELKKAQKIIDKAEDDFEGYFSLELLRIKILIKNQKFEEAKDLLNYLKNIDEKNQAIYNLLSEVYLNLGKREEYTLMLRKLYKLDPFNKNVKNLLGLKNRESFNLSTSGLENDKEYLEEPGQFNNTVESSADNIYEKDLTKDEDAEKRASALRRYKENLSKDKNSVDDDFIKKSSLSVSNENRYDGSESFVTLPESNVDSDLDEFDLLEEVDSFSLPKVDSDLNDTEDEGVKKLIDKQRELEEDLKSVDSNLTFYKDINLLDNEIDLKSDDGFRGEVDHNSENNSSFKKDVVDNLLAEKRGTYRKPIKIATTTLGEIYNSQGQYQKSREVYLHLLEDDPTNVDYRKALIDSEFKIAKQRIEEEINYYTGLLRNHPENKKYLERFKRYKDELDSLSKEKNIKISQLDQMNES